MSVKLIAMRITLATRRTVLISPCSLSDPRVLVERALDTSHLLSEQPARLLPHLRKIHPQVEDIECDQDGSDQPSELPSDKHGRGDKQRAECQVRRVETEHEQVRREGVQQRDDAEVERKEHYDRSNNVAPREFRVPAPRGRDHPGGLFEAFAHADNGHTKKGLRKPDAREESSDAVDNEFGTSKHHDYAKKK